MPVFPKLLASPGDIKGYASKLGATFHIDNKSMMRSAIGLAHKRMWPAIKHTKEQNWVKDHVAAQMESFDFVAGLMRYPLNREHLNGWQDGDANEKMLRRGMEMYCTVLAQDTFYDMLELVRLKWIHEHWDRFEDSAQKAYQLVSFPKFYENLINHYEAMSAPLPDITNEPDEADLDCVKLEESAKNGMEHKG